MMIGYVLIFEVKSNIIPVCTLLHITLITVRPYTNYSYEGKIKTSDERQLNRKTTNDESDH